MWRWTNRLKLLNLEHLDLFRILKFGFRIFSYLRDDRAINKQDLRPKTSDKIDQDGLKYRRDTISRITKS